MDVAVFADSTRCLLTPFFFFLTQHVWTELFEPDHWELGLTQGKSWSLYGYSLWPEQHIYLQV